MNLIVPIRRARALGLLLCSLFALLAGGAAQAAGGAASRGSHAGKAARAAGGGISSSRGAAPFQLNVLPYPGTPDASPQTQIDFLELSPAQLRSLTVKGSRSGVHRGRLTAIRGAQGLAFQPSQPFAAAERVTVSARIASGDGHGLRRDARSSRAQGLKHVQFAFTVAAPIRTAATPSAAGEDGPAIVHARISAATNFTTSYHSESWLHPPVVSLSGKNPDQKSGDILTDAHRSIQAGPLILNPQGQVLWFDPLPGGQAGFDLAVQQYAGQSVLTFWQGAVSNGVGTGEDVILNHAYQQVATVAAANGYHADLHEFQITPQGNAFITAYAPVQADLSSVGGPKSGTLLDAIIQEINIRTGQLLWEWHAYGHVHLAESYAGKPNGGAYDFFHIDSVQPLSGGNLLVSSRHMFAVYEINQATGKILWVLGGKHSSFKLGHGANFSWQHDARMQSNGNITVFDDGAGYKKTESQSRGMLIHLNMRTHQATLVHQYAHVPPVLSPAEGSLQPLYDGDVFVGFGSNPYLAEFTKGGRQIFSASFPYPVEFYRAYRSQWSGQPTGSPYAAASAAGSGTTVYASWNGATNIASWRVYAGSSPGGMSYVTQQPFRAFETAISTPSAGPYFSVQAVDAQGHALGTSAPVTR